MTIVVHTRSLGVVHTGADEASVKGDFLVCSVVSNKKIVGKREVYRGVWPFGTRETVDDEREVKDSTPIHLIAVGEVLQFYYAQAIEARSDETAKQAEEPQP